MAMTSQYNVLALHVPAHAPLDTLGNRSDKLEPPLLEHWFFGAFFQSVIYPIYKQAAPVTSLQSDEHALLTVAAVLLNVGIQHILACGWYGTKRHQVARCASTSRAPADQVHMYM